MKISNSNDSYYYYKKVFGNKYISKHIFEKVKEMNLVSLYNRRSYVVVEDGLSPIRNYYNMDFKFIVQNKYYSVLLDLYKPLVINYENGEIVNDNPRLHFSDKELREEYFKDLVMDLSIKSESTSLYSQEGLNQFFKKFYYLNKQHIITKQFKNIPIKSLDQNQTIQHQQQQQLKKNQHQQQQIQLYQLQQLQQEQHVVNTGIKVQNLDLLELTIFYSNYQLFKIVWNEYYCNYSLDSAKKSKFIDWCLMNGDIETLDYLYNTLGFKEFDEKNAFQYACLSENRERTLRYLFNVMDFQVYYNSVKLQSCILFKVLQVEHTLYKQLNNCLPIDSSIKSLEFLNLSNNLPFKEFLNLNLNINLQDQQFKSTIFKILNLDLNLINNNNNYYFNNLNDSNSNNSNNSNNSSCNNNNNNNKSNSNNSNNKLIKNFKSLFKSSTSSTPYTASASESASNISFDKLNLNNYNTKREVKRYYIYYNLLNQDSLEKNLMLLKFIFKFINKYEEYQLLDHLLYPDKFSYLQNTFIYNQYKQSPNNSNNNNNNRIKKKLNISDIGRPASISASSTSTNNENNDVYFINKVTPIISSYHTDLFIHIYNNHRNQFNWSHKNLSINIASNQNFKLIKFLYENEIPIYEHILDTIDLDSLEIVEYLVSVGFKFTKVSFFNSIKNSNIELFKFYIDHSTSDIQKEFIYSTINNFYTLFSDNLIFLKQLNFYIENLILDQSKFKSNLITDLKSKLILPNYLK